MPTTPSSNSTAGVPATATAGPTLKQIVRQKLTTFIPQYFGNSLANEIPNDIINLLMSLIQHESAFVNPPRLGAIVVGSKGTYFQNEFLQYSAVAKVYNTGTQQQRFNLQQSCRAFGLMQVMGQYLIKGVTKPCQLLVCRPDLASVVNPILVNPGDDITSTMGPIGNQSATDQQITNQIIAGLIVFERHYLYPGSINYGSKITNAMAGYYGIGKAVVANGVPQPSVQQYVDDVIHKDYALANNSTYSGGGSSTQNAPSSTGPNQTIASGSNPKMPGCGA